ncbi:binding-protein-dependent transporter inner membrane component [Nitritalea halalkaliphila LW7]|uniref:Binding-protein-dependent transporter inner membrane component n=1 Tax=Nitritalea halalkaliphila LW7 TaxID=1189621 RepID=I5C5I6_9BACT|nr:binding-protein-dependent transporter inner membrane component [Nitritalea halalkaliphila]EIM77088.1 binding-protein-dependent transporter inner membrane component [Nitritalea halalkaliphila LW7]
MEQMDSLCAGYFGLVATPLLTIFVKLFERPGETWTHMAENLLPHYFQNTLLLLVGVACFTFLLGVSSAWFVSTYDFPGRKWFEWLLILP